MESSYAERSLHRQLSGGSLTRPSLSHDPLKGLWTHTKGGFYHDGRFPTLLDVVNHYDVCFSLELTDQNKADMVEFLKSLPVENRD